MRLGLLAGKGDLPYQVIDAHLPHLIIGFYDQTPEPLATYAKDKGIPFEWVPMGQVKKTLNLFKSYNVKNVALAGSVDKPTLSMISLDWLAIRWLMKLKLASFGDDLLLRSVVKLIEAEGFNVVPVFQLLPELMCPTGCLTPTTPNAQAQKDIRLGFQVIQTLSPLDVGQAVVIQEGIVLGIEAIEGTDELIQRCGAYRRAGNSAPLLIKAAKDTQTHLADLPTIGPQTIQLLHEQKFQGIAVQAQKTQIIHKQKVLELCKDFNLFLVGEN